MNYATKQAANSQLDTECDKFKSNFDRAVILLGDVKKAIAEPDRLKGDELKRLSVYIDICQESLAAADNSFTMLRGIMKMLQLDNAAK